MKKKLLIGLFALTMCITVSACGKEAVNNQAENEIVEEESNEEKPEESNQEEEITDGSIGEILASDFKKIAEDEGLNTQAIADKLLENQVIEFGSATMEVKEGLLTGFGNAEIKGFSEGTMFAPMIGSIPFVGYVFTVEEDVDAFMEVLKENADPRWNVCTEADETVVETKGNKVLFLMCPKSFEEE